MRNWTKNAGVQSDDSSKCEDTRWALWASLSLNSRLKTLGLPENCGDVKLANELAQTGVGRSVESPTANSIASLRVMERPFIHDSENTSLLSNRRLSSTACLC